MHDDKINILARVGRSSPGKDGTRPSASILTLAAVSYGARPNDEATVPTGFDPGAARLFEAIMEGAYLVASADGVFDASEREAFERVLTVACGGVVDDGQIHALVADFADQLAEDGIDKRVKAIAEAVTRPSHAMEVVRIAGLLAQTSEDVSKVERDVLVKLAAAFSLTEADVDTALADVQKALAAPKS